MEQQSAPKSSTITTYGLYLGIASIVFSLITYYGGLLGNKGFSYLGYLIPIVFIVLGLNHYKNNVNNGILRYGSGVGLGVLISVVGGVVSSVFTYVLLAIIDPSIHQQIINLAHEEALKSGTSEAQLEQAEGIMNAMMSPLSLSIMGILGSALIGLIIALIVAAIVKKDPEVTFE
ncbi:DUF4199 domain-containing protein [Labilibacter sediminis]|nr:DUF4199 domain-containing protein [Labilibacter sediminis]